MKKKWLFFLLLAGIFVAFSCTASAASAPSAVITAPNGQTVILASESGALYLPAAVGLSDVSLSWNGKTAFFYRTAAETESRETSDGHIDLSALSPSYDAENTPCYDLILTDGAMKTASVRIYHDESLPALFVSTSKGLSYIEASKENRDGGTSFLILDRTGAVAYGDDTAGEIKGRGNATWSYAKKGYQIKLGAKSALLGMESAKTWILIPNYVDQSQMHNALAFRMSEDLCLPNTIDYRYVNLYIDGSYRGLYLLTEKVQIASGRIDIRNLEKATEKANPDVSLSSLQRKTVQSGALIDHSILTSYTYYEGVQNPADISGGYLVELDNVWGSSEPSYFTTQNGNTYVVKSPEYCSQSEMEYIASLFAEMEEAVYSADGYNRKGRAYSSYIDMDSFAGTYAVQEMMKNWDAYQSSLYFYKDADADGVTADIFMGPIWDMDNTLGNLKFETYASDRSFLWAQNGKFQHYVRALAAPLMQHEDYRSLVAEKIDALCLQVRRYEAAGGFIEQTYNEIQRSALMDRARFDIATPSRWVLSGGGYKVSTKFVHFTRYGGAFDEGDDTAIGYLRSFLAERAEALLLSVGSGTLPPAAEETTTEESTVPETTTLPATETVTEAATESAPESASETTGARPNESQKSIPKGKLIVSIAVLLPVFALIFLLRRAKKRS